MKQILIPMLIGFVLGMALASAAKAEIGDTYPIVGCIASHGERGDCYAMLCTVVTNTREHCVKVPTPKARPVIPCDTDSDCMAKNGGNGDPVNVQCFDPQEDETYGENGILCRDGEDY